MADVNMGMSPFEDTKAAKAKLKADKKEYRKHLKEMRKEQRDKEREFADRSAELAGDDAGGFATFIITVLIVIIWLAIMGLLIKLNVGHFGSDILAPLIKDVPYLNVILPEESKSYTDTTAVVPEEGVEVTNEEGETESIQTLEQAYAYIKRLEQALQSEMTQNSEYVSQIEKLEAEDLSLLKDSKNSSMSSANNSMRKLFTEIMLLARKSLPNTMSRSILTVRLRYIKRSNRAILMKLPLKPLLRPIPA